MWCVKPAAACRHVVAPSSRLSHTRARVRAQRCDRDVYIYCDLYLGFADLDTVPERRYVNMFEILCKMNETNNKEQIKRSSQHQVGLKKSKRIYKK